MVFGSAKSWLGGLNVFVIGGNLLALSRAVKACGVADACFTERPDKEFAESIRIIVKLLLLTLINSRYLTAIVARITILDFASHSWVRYHS